MQPKKRFSHVQASHQQPLLALPADELQPARSTGGRPRREAMLVYFIGTVFERGPVDSHDAPSFAGSAPRASRAKEAHPRRTRRAPSVARASVSARLPTRRRSPGSSPFRHLARLRQPPPARLTQRRWLLPSADGSRRSSPGGTGSKPGSMPSRERREEPERPSSVARRARGRWRARGSGGASARPVGRRSVI